MLSKIIMLFDKEKFKKEFNTQGYSILENVLSTDFVSKIKGELTNAIEQEVNYHAKNDYIDFGMVMLCSLYGGSFIDILDNPRITEPFNLILGDGCIIYAYTSSSMPPHRTNYSARIHVDCPRLIPGYITNMAATILLDDFTEENGAMWYLPYSQDLMEAPSNEYFLKNAKRLIEKAGTAIFFNSRIWHMGGHNKTNKWRHALTFNISRPWMKQRIDIPRAMSNMDISSYSEVALQKLGFLSQVPASYDEYYVPLEKRKYKQKVE